MEQFEYYSEAWFEQARNLDNKDIDYLLSIIRQSLRMKLSAMLVDTSEDDQLICDIVLDTDSQGLSDAEKAHVDAAFQTTEGIICVVIDNCIVDVSDLCVEELLEITIKLQEEYGKESKTKTASSNS